VRDRDRGGGVRERKVRKKKQERGYACGSYAMKNMTKTKTASKNDKLTLRF
jgi:hypothetical protein